MLAGLRRRLTLLMTLLTGAVLAAALLVACGMAQAQQLQARQNYFLQLCGQLAQQLESNSPLLNRQLTAIEQQNQLALQITDNGRPLTFPHGWESTTPREALFEQASGSGALPLFGAATVRRFTGAEDEPYWALAARIPLPRGVCELVVVQSLEDESAALRRTALAYGAVFFAGLLLLTLVCRLLAGFAVRPTARSLRQQAEFVAAAGHELRGPVAAVQANLEAMDTGATLLEKSRCQAAALAETQRLGRLVGDLLVLAGADAARLRWAPGPVDAESVLIETTEQFRPVAKQRGFELRLELPEEPLPPLTGDEERLRQILMILLENATAYAPIGTAITLRGQAEKRHVIFSVADKGPGVPEADRASIFDRFYRANQSRSDKEHFGLGLSVAQELAALHGGTLKVENAPTGGAVFSLQLPL